MKINRRQNNKINRNYNNKINKKIKMICKKIKIKQIKIKKI